MNKYLKFISVLLVTSIVTSSPPVFAGGGFSGSGSISDTAYDATTWNGDTTNAPSKNAVRDKIESMSGAAAVFYTDAATTGHVTYVGCSDSIATAIAAATAGDTLQFGSCTYTIATNISDTKGVYLRGASDGSTIFNITGNNITGITGTACGSGLNNITFTGTKVASAYTLDRSAATICSPKDAIFSKVRLLIQNSSNTGTMNGIWLQNTGAIFEDIICDSTFTSPSTSTAQHHCLQETLTSTANAAITVYMKDVSLNTLMVSPGGTTEGRPFKIFNTTGNESTFGATVNIYNSLFKNRGADNLTSVLCQGTNVVCNLYDAMLDPGSAPSSLQTSIECKNSAVCHVYGGKLVSESYATSASGTIDFPGLMTGTSILISQGTQPLTSTATTATAATDIFNGTGETGGNISTSGTRTGGAGADHIETLGTGGQATGANTAATGGPGGGFVLTAGNGAVATATSGINVGGAGGDFTIISGDGGAAANGSSNTGGRAGNITLNYGTVGTGGSPTQGRITFSGDNGAAQDEDVYFQFGNNIQYIGTTTNVASHLYVADNAKTWGVDRVTVADTAGKSLTITAGGATSAATNKSGGGLILTTGKSTGSGTADMTFKTSPGVAASTTDNSLQTSIFIDGSTNFIGLGGLSTTPTYNLSWANSGDRTIGIERRTTSAAGRAMTLNAGGAQSGGTDLSGGTLNLTAGMAVGNNGSVINLQASKSGQGSGTTDRTPTTVVSIAPTSTSAGLTVTASSDIGWSVVTGANTACNSTCTSAAVVGFDTVTGLVGPADATADTCICAGAS